jgi:acetyl esterase/lipase
MGSTYFYLEFLMSWMTLLEDAGYRNPAIFGLEYTLVNDASFPTQLLEVVHGYEHVLEVARNPSLVCVSGDSAGATLILSMLLYLADQYSKPAAQILAKPRLAVLISPWVTLLSARHKNTASDYLNAEALHRYGMQYVGSKAFPSDPVVSPGSCQKEGWWRRASPGEGFFITYGAEEVFATDIEDLIALLKKAGVPVVSVGEEGGVHAWPVASLFLSTERAKRLKGLNGIVEQIREKMPRGLRQSARGA